MIELIVAVGCLSFLSVGVLEGISQTYRCSTSSQNRILAANIVQVLVDDLRNSNWTTIQAAAGQTLSSANGQILLYRMGSTQAGGVIHPRPILGDFAAVEMSAEGRSNRFQGEVTERLVNMGGGQVQVTITVSWPAENGGSNRQLEASTVISEFGIHN